MADDTTIQLEPQEQQKILSLDELVKVWGKPLQEEQFKQKKEKFNPQQGASHRTWLAISNYVAYHEPRKLNALFQGIEFPNMNLAQETVSFPQTLEDVMTAQTRAKFAYLRATPELYGSMSTRLQLFQNIVEAMGDPTANFRVGRNISVNKDMAAWKLAMMAGAKGALKVFGVNPAKIIAKHMNSSNSGLNTFLDTRVIQYGSNFMDVRVEYISMNDVSAQGDHYTLGTILGGLELISAFKKIDITAIQTPFDKETEERKERIFDPSFQYSANNYISDPTHPVFLYRYTFQEPIQFAKRILRVIGDFARHNLPSRLTQAQIQQDQQVHELLLKQSQLDERTQSEYQARMEVAEAKIATESARANAAEAKLTLEQSVSATNQVFGEMRTLAHDSKNYALTLRAGTCDLLRESMRHLPLNLQDKYSHLFDSDESLTSGLQQMKQDLSLPQDIQPLIDQTQHSLDFIQSITAHTQRSLSIIDDIIANERLVMAGGIPVEMQEIPYEKVIKPVIDNVKAVYPTVSIEYNLPETMVVTADGRLLKVALMNLVSNAVEASVPTGKVKIDVSQRLAGERLFTIMNIYQSGYLPPNIADRLNNGEKFTTKEKGNATGAAASYNIITGPHNGKVTYESLGQDQEYGGKIRIVI